MLKSLYLENFILIDKAEVTFEKGFTVISGETGSGKTLLMQSLSLLMGQKADSKIIRGNAESAKISATFTLSQSQILLLKEIGISSSKELTLSREFFQNGKNKSYINKELVPTAALKSISTEILEIVSPHTSLELKEEKEQRAYLDIFAKLEKEVKEYQLIFKEEKKLVKELCICEEEHEKAKPLLLFYASCIEEIKSAALKENEEESLFEDYKKNLHAKDLAESARQALEILSESDLSIFSQLKQIKLLLLQMQKQGANLEKALSFIQETHASLNEISYFLSGFSDECPVDPYVLQEIDNRLTLIKTLKKKYGSSIQEILLHQKNLQEKIHDFEQYEERVSTLTTALEKVRKKREELAFFLTQKRTEKARELSLLLTKKLHFLNMKNCSFTIQISPVEANEFGSDLIQFYLAANLGEHSSPLKFCASGGELSRVLFALKVLLAKEQKEKILLFDEIDANIGGETASLLAKELKEIGSLRQIICITHFPQVAAFGSHHFKIHKKVELSRTKTIIELLDNARKKEELLRMAGGIPHIYN